MHEHGRAMHSGINWTIEAVRDHYFINRVREVATNVRKHCRLCKWIRAHHETANFGAIPSFRLKQSKPPFTNTGLDIFTPRKTRMKLPGKRYGLIFTCATTRVPIQPEAQTVRCHVMIILPSECCKMSTLKLIIKPVMPLGQMLSYQVDQSVATKSNSSSTPLTRWRGCRI